MAAESLAFLHQKGGTGKTTLAIASAQAMAARGRAVLLLDMDYQGTASAWGERFAAAFNVGMPGGIEVRSLARDEVADSLARFAAGFDAIIVDAPPTLSPLTANLLVAVDHVVVPTRPSWPDVWALATLVALAERDAVLAKLAVVFNQSDAAAIPEPLRDAVRGAGLRLLPEPVTQSDDFAAIFRDGVAGPRAIRAVEALLAQLPEPR